MSPEEWAQFQEGFRGAWKFIAETVKNSIPAGHVYGRQAEQCERPSEVGDLDLGKPWDFLGVDWARNQVIAIHRVLNQLSQRLSEVEARVIELDQELAGTDKAVAAHNDRIAGLESKVEWIQQSGGEAQRMIDMSIADLSDQGNADRDRLNGVWSAIAEIQSALTNYGIPLGGRVAPTKAHDDAVREAVLNEAAERVRDYMGGHFSEASVRGVVAALRGEDDSRIITDHAFRYSSPDRRHCSYRKNHRGPRCDMLRSDHSYAQAQPDGPIRPV